MISEQTFVLLSGVLTFGAPLVFAISELIVLRRPPRDDPGPPPRDFEPPPPKPLPDCLIPRPMVRPMVRQRELEDA